MRIETYLSDKQVAERYKIGRCSIWRWIRDYNFPKPTKLSPGCSRFKLSLIEAWEEKREVA